MLKLSAPARDPYWLDLTSVSPGLRLKMRPVTVAMIIAARAEAAEIFREAGADEEPEAMRRAGIALVRAFAHAGLTEWEGIGDENDEPAPVTPENVDRLLGLWPVHDALDRLYVEPALLVVTEKNASSNSPAGTFATGATSTAQPAA